MDNPLVDDIFDFEYKEDKKEIKKEMSINFKGRPVVFSGRSFLIYGLQGCGKTTLGIYLMNRIKSDINLYVVPRTEDNTENIIHQSINSTDNLLISVLNNISEYKDLVRNIVNQRDMTFTLMLDNICFGDPKMLRQFLHYVFEDNHIFDNCHLIVVTTSNDNAEPVGISYYANLQYFDTIQIIK